jgi:toxin FitB
VNYILDTNVISEIVAAQPNAQVTRWIEKVDPNRLFLSVITIGELKKGIEKLPNSRRKDLLDRWLMEDLPMRFHEHILPIDTDTMLLWGSLNARLEASGRPISAIDSLLASIAMQYQYMLVTRNSSHFEQTGILLLNPWNE